jgi:hypothetical protein
MPQPFKYLIVAAGFLAIASAGVVALAHSVGGMTRFGCMQIMHSGWNQPPNQQWRQHP